MASSVDTILNELPINSVASDELLKQMESAGQLEPNQIYMTPDEDSEDSKTEILWTNTSPTVAYAGGTITLKNNEYDVYEFGYRYDTTNDFEKSDFIRVNSGVRGLLSFVNTPNIIYARALSIVSRTQIGFSSSYQGIGGGESVNNSTIIPIYIRGWKFS